MKKLLDSCIPNFPVNASFVSPEIITIMGVQLCRRTVVEIDEGFIDNRVILGLCQRLIIKITSQ